MKRLTLFSFATALLLAAAGCGRSSLGSRCIVDDDCGSDLICFDGQCSVPGDTDPECASDDDCPDGSCVEGLCEADGENNTNNAACFENDAGICVRDACDAGASNNCAVVPCDIGCPPTQTQSGCECVDVSCDTDDECSEGQLCLDGVCDACKEDDQCPGDLVCSEGTCVEDAECSADEDCPPDQRCAADEVCRDRPACVFDDDCANGLICFNGRCTVADECQVDLDCPDGQECVGGNCFEALCRGPEDCEEGQLCDAGECVDQPVMVECQVATQNQTVTEGQRVPLEAFAFDMAGNAVAASFTWTSSAPGVARVVPGPNALGGTDGGAATLTAALSDGTPCTGAAVLTNPGPPMTNTIRVVVTDVESGAPVEGALVRIDLTSTVATDAQGVALLPDPGTAYELSVFDDDYNWLTVQDVSATDIRLPLLRRDGAGELAGFTGEFDTSGLNTSGNITLGLAGASLAGGLLELGLGRLLGDTFVSPLEIPGVVDEEIPLPGGIIAYGGALGFNVDLKKTYYAQSAGGPRIAWGLAGMLPFGQLLDFFQGGDFDGTNVIGQLLPLFNRFDHGAFPRVFQEYPRVVDGVDFDNDGDTTELLPDYQSFPTIDLRPSVRQNLITDVAISNFPQLQGGQSELAILVGGVVLPSPGFVPTGISATTDEDGDGRPDLRRLSIAPSYGPLVGGRYAILAITFADGGGGPGTGPGGFSLPDEFSVALWNGQNYPVSLSLGTFPDRSNAGVNDQTRTVTMSTSAGPMYRVRMVGQDRSWDVWSVGSPGQMGQFAHTVTVPVPPVSGPDLFSTGRIYVDAIQTNTNLDDLVAASGVGLRNAGLVSTAYNRTLVREP